MSRKTSNRKILNKIMKKVVSFTENRYRKITDSYSKSEIYKQCLPHLNSYGRVKMKHTNSKLLWQTIAKAKIPPSTVINKPVNYVQSFSGFTCEIRIGNSWSRVAPQSLVIRLSISFPPSDLTTDATNSIVFDVLSNIFIAYWIQGIRLVSVFGSSNPEYDGLYIQLLTCSAASSQYYENTIVTINNASCVYLADNRNERLFEVMSTSSADDCFVPATVREEIDLLISNETSHIQTFATTTIESKFYGMNQKLDKTGGTLTGNIEVKHNGNGTTNGPTIAVEYNNGSTRSNLSLQAATNGMNGLFSNSLSSPDWLIQESNVSGYAYTRATSAFTRSYEIKANADLNTFIPLIGLCSSCGFWYCSSNATVATLKNCPTTNAFCLRVERHAGYYQELTEYVTFNPRKFFRNYYNGSWGQWHEVSYNFLYKNNSNPSYTSKGIFVHIKRSNHSEISLLSKTKKSILGNSFSFPIGSNALSGWKLINTTVNFTNTTNIGNEIELTCSAQVLNSSNMVSYSVFLQNVADYDVIFPMIEIEVIFTFMKL